MFIRQTTKRHKGKTYTHYLLVESYATPKGPRQRTVCSLGDLAPGPKQKWQDLARRLEAALCGQLSLGEPDPLVEKLAEKVRAQPPSTTPAAPSDDAEPSLISIDPEQISVEQARQLGPVYVGHQMWQRLGLPEILREIGFSPKACLLSEVMTLNRLIAPCSEHAMPDWVRRTALSDLLHTDLSELDDERLYRNLDRLHPNRERIEAALAEREKNLFGLEDTYFFYDLTSHYFEGQAQKNPKAQRGYSRDHRPDCKQVVVGLVIDPQGFPKAHEVFEGSRQDRKSLDEMLASLERRLGRHGGGTVIVDRGMAYEENLQQIRARGHHYLVAARQSERNAWLEQLEEAAGWEEVVRQPSPRNRAQKKTQVWVKKMPSEGDLYVLCRSDARSAKDRAIREKKEKRLLNDLGKLQARVAGGRLRRPEKIHQAIGRLRERYPRVARYYAITHDPQDGQLRWQLDTEAQQRACLLDGSYLLRTSRQELSAEEVWRLYILLTRAEDAFRDLKSPLSERPIYHQLEHRVEAHIFLCVLAYHLLVVIEKSFLDRGIHTSWATLREQLSTQQVVTIVLPTNDGRLLKIRRASKPEPEHCEIYDVLGLPHQAMEPVKLWLPIEPADSDE